MAAAVVMLLATAGPARAKVLPFELSISGPGLPGEFRMPPAEVFQRINGRNDGYLGGVWAKAAPPPAVPALSYAVALYVYEGLAGSLRREWVAGAKRTLAIPLTYYPDVRLARVGAGARWNIREGQWVRLAPGFEELLRKIIGGAPLPTASPLPEPSRLPSWVPALVTVMSGFALAAFAFSVLEGGPPRR